MTQSNKINNEIYTFFDLFSVYLSKNNQIIDINKNNIEIYHALVQEYSKLGIIHKLIHQLDQHIKSAQNQNNFNIKNNQSTIDNQVTIL